MCAYYHLSPFNVLALSLSIVNGNSLKEFVAPRKVRDQLTEVLLLLSVCVGPGITYVNISLTVLCSILGNNKCP